METTIIRFEPEERSRIQAYADFVGRTFSDVVREAALETVEAAADHQAHEVHSPQMMACASLPTRSCAWPWRPNELSGRMVAYGHEGAACYREKAVSDDSQMGQGQPGGLREPKGDSWSQSSSGYESGMEVVRVGHRQSVYRKLSSGI